MKFTFYGHSSFSIEINGVHLLFDPFISNNPKASHIDVSSINADYILLSHGHEDHIADAFDIAQRTGAKIISNYEIVGWYNSKGIENAHPLAHGGAVEMPFGKVKYTNAHHTSSMPDGSYGGQPGGFLITTESGNFYFAGDTGLTMDMKLIPMWAKLDFAVLPIGDNFTMGYEDAVIASDFIECNKIIGVHYDTFGYIEIDTSKAKAAFEAKGKELILVEIGASIEL